MSKITSVIPTYNNLPFLKLTVKSVRQNCYYNDMPIFIFAENCTDGTNEWLAENALFSYTNPNSTSSEKPVSGRMRIPAITVHYDDR